jgi:hypothetical protein
MILFDQHRARIENMRSDVDDKRPPYMPKSQRAEIERRQKEALIEQDNRILLDRLAIAMTVKNIDNERKMVNFISLHDGRKKRENTRIEKDNQRLLRSIQHTVPVYNHTEWERDSDKRIHVLKNMTKFPDLWKKQQSTTKSERTQKIAMDKSQQLSLLYKLDSVIERASFCTGSLLQSSSGNISSRQSTARSDGETRRVASSKSLEYSERGSTSRGNSARKPSNMEKENASNQHESEYSHEYSEIDAGLRLDSDDYFDDDDFKDPYNR